MNDGSVMSRRAGESHHRRGGAGLGLPADLFRKSRRRARLVALS